MRYGAYVRVSDGNRGNGETQRADIETYCKQHGLHIERWVEELASGSKSDVQDRKLMKLVAEGFSVVMTDVTRLGRRKVFDLLGVIGQICRNGELHLTYTGRVINQANQDDAETIFTVVGGSFAAMEETRKRSERARAAHARRKAQGLLSGRPIGAVVRSKLDPHAGFIIKELKSGTEKTKIVEKLKRKKKVDVCRTQLYRWIKKRML